MQTFWFLAFIKELRVCFSLRTIFQIVWYLLQCSLNCLPCDRTSTLGENSIRIFNGCEVRIENSVNRVTVPHHEACRVMPNSYPEWWNFQLAPNWFFFLHILPSTTTFKFTYGLFCQFYAKISTFSIKKYLVQLLPSKLTSEHLAENNVKNWHCDIKKTSWRHAYVVLHAREASSCKTTFPSPGQKFQSGTEE